MSNPISSALGFFGWGGGQGGSQQPVVDRSAPAQSMTGKITSIGSRRPQMSTGIIYSVDATAYADAKDIAAHYREGASIIVNMADMSELDQRRMVDFMSGLKEGLGGGLQRVATKVFLLVPASVQTNQAEDEDDEFGPADGLVINPMR